MRAYVLLLLLGVGCETADLNKVEATLRADGYSYLTINESTSITSAAGCGQDDEWGVQFVGEKRENRIHGVACGGNGKGIIIRVLAIEPAAVRRLPAPLPTREERQADSILAARQTNRRNALIDSLRKGTFVLPLKQVER